MSVTAQRYKAVLAVIGDGRTLDEVARVTDFRRVRDSYFGGAQPVLLPREADSKLVRELSDEWQ